MQSNPASVYHQEKQASRHVRPTIDRFVFVFMAALLFITVLTGFIPSSLDKIAAVQSGQRAGFPAVLHFHAALMGSWLLLLLVQTSMVASGNQAIHRKLGLVAMGLIPAMVIAGFILVPVNFSTVWNLDPAVMPAEAIAAAKSGVSNIALFQIRIGLLFALYTGLALYFRKKDSQTHKRLMILATIIPMPAAVTRIEWIPSSFPDSGISPDLIILCLVLPLFLYDLLKQKRIPRAYLMWVPGWIGTSAVVHLLWGSSWWMETAPVLMGVID